MAKTKTKQQDYNRQSKAFAFQLYTEWTNYNELLTAITKDAKKWAYNTHDKDIDDKTGELKKVHTHLVVTYDSRQTRKGLHNYYQKYETSFRDEFIVPLISLTGMLRYLTHKDDIDKYQYDESNIKTNDIEWYNENVIEQESIENGFLKILKVINELDENTTLYDIGVWAKENHCQKAFTAKASVIGHEIKNHNDWQKAYNDGYNKGQSQVTAVAIKIEKEKGILNNLTNNFDRVTIENENDTFDVMRVDYPKSGGKKK